jgi:hypothetical protein
MVALKIGICLFEYEFSLIIKLVKMNRRSCMLRRISEILKVRSRR